MSLNKQVRRIAIIGTGVIGASWAAQYLARGFDVIATNPNPNAGCPIAESQLRKDIDAASKELTIIGLSPGATRERPTFTSNMKEALSKADFVQGTHLRPLEPRCLLTRQGKDICRDNNTL
jgi:carnitine 3-dehydrogenase